MKFIIFRLIDPGDVELTPDGGKTFLKFVQIGTVVSSEFSEMVSLNWIYNDDGPDSFNVTHTSVMLFSRQFSPRKKVQILVEVNQARRIASYF